MSERAPKPTPEERSQVEPAKDALRDALQSIKTPAQAEQVVDSAARAAQGLTEQQVREEQGDAPDAAAAIRAAAQTPGDAKTPATLIEAARQVATSDGGQHVALEQALQAATNPEVKGETDPATETGRGLLRESIVRRMRLYEKFDTRLFLAVNHMPHPPRVNRGFLVLTDLMNAGFGWVLLLLIVKLVGGTRNQRALYQVLPPLWFATMSVEYPIKEYFRRRRPFYDIVQAIAVGKKPGGYSFPSGHSAAGFAGAWLMSRTYPRLRPLWYLIAALTGFSRVYLGAHYPSDVVSGALFGTAIAEVTRRVMNRADDGEDSRGETAR